MLTIRFARRGRKGQAFFHIVAAEKSRAVQKKFVEKLGYYNPHTNGGEGELVINNEQLVKHINNGAQVSQSVARKLAKAGIKEVEKFVKARHTVEPKPKEEPKAEEPAPVVEEAPATEEKSAEEDTPEAETPAEESKEEEKTE